jgi:hypothetical protein
MLELDVGNIGFTGHRERPGIDTDPRDRDLGTDGKELTGRWEGYVVPIVVGLEGRLGQGIDTVLGKLVGGPPGQEGKLFLLGQIVGLGILSIVGIPEDFGLTPHVELVCGVLGVGGGDFITGGREGIETVEPTLVQEELNAGTTGGGFLVVGGVTHIISYGLI